MESIVLIGFMGVGKTTIGHMLSEKVGLHVVDMDEYIVKQEGMPVREIFERFGEGHFRYLETAVLSKLLNEACIITAGGGIVERKENRTLLGENGCVIHLSAPFESLWERLEGDPDRPLAQNPRHEVESLFSRRIPLYEEARTHEVDTGGKDEEAVTREILSLLGRN
ncbi:shikimate kinase [Rossellomorea marisflavi]|uniref:shikimate kinase n=1 Tax=Rossellomorea marisflavi TaxID=189381 RepID=UPI0011E80509|nr:shikimate kinase [Rossellomorea marisflavi]TYO73110.1 shikimate kinase [Rossellomorea marisflavi]